MDDEGIVMFFNPLDLFLQKTAIRLLFGLVNFPAIGTPIPHH